ncbi:MAG: hypothetical protein ACYDCO_28030 [Armatimonadota bacterium]
MRTWILFLCGLLLVALMLPAAAQKAAKPKSALRGEWAIMVKECNLTADQQAKLEEKTKAMNAAVAEWDAQHKAQTDKLKADITAAKEAKDKAKLKELNAQKRALDAERAGLTQQHRKGIMELLTPEQKTAWAVYQLQQDVLNKFKKAKLTEEQIAKIKPLCTATQQELAKLGADDAKGRKALMDKLFTDVEQQILTAEQRALIVAPAKPKEKTK